MPKPPTAPAYVLTFIQAVCPDAPALYAASFSEKTCLQDATEIILRYRAALERIADTACGEESHQLVALRALNP